MESSGQIGPLANLPENWAPHFLGSNLPFSGELFPANWAPGKFGCDKLGPGKLGPCISYICIGYILPTIGEYMLVECIYWYWIYSANNWEIYVNWRV